MGKNLQNSSLVQRTGKVAFYYVPKANKYVRMEGFTELSSSKNPKEYSRQYVDEDFERTDIVGYAPSISYAFDRYKGNVVLDDIIEITENEYIGEKMVRDIMVVDMTTAGTSDGKSWVAFAKVRKFAVIPDTDGGTTDCMTYSGNFKARGETMDYAVTSEDDWQTISDTTLKEKSGAAIISVSAGETKFINKDGCTQVHAEFPKGTKITIEAQTNMAGAGITLYKTQSDGTNWQVSNTTTGELRLIDTIENLGKSHYLVLVHTPAQSVGYEINITGTAESSTETTSIENSEEV